MKIYVSIVIAILTLINCAPKKKNKSNGSQTNNIEGITTDINFPENKQSLHLAQQDPIRFPDDMPTEPGSSLTGDCISFYNSSNTLEKSYQINFKLFLPPEGYTPDSEAPLVSLNSKEAASIKLNVPLNCKVVRLVAQDLSIDKDYQLAGLIDIVSNSDTNDWDLLYFGASDKFRPDGDKVVVHMKTFSPCTGECRLFTSKEEEINPETPTPPAETEPPTETPSNSDIKITMIQEGLPTIIEYEYIGTTPNISLIEWDLNGDQSIDATGNKGIFYYNAPGEYYVKIKAHADGKVLESSLDKTIDVQLKYARKVFPIANDSDDAEERTIDGKTYLDSSGLNLPVHEGRSGKNQVIGLRFQNVDIPITSKIKKAFIRFTSRAESTNQSDVEIHGELSNNSQTFTLDYKNISSRQKTSSSVQWSIPSWSGWGLMGEDQSTPDLTSLINEIRSHAGYSSGAPLTFFIKGTGTRLAYSADSTSHKDFQPQLVIEYEYTEKCCWTPEITSTNTPYFPNFSYAGYKWGEESIPNPNGDIINVLDFGAISDDGKDDSEAIRKAIESIPTDNSSYKIIYIPAGKYHLNDIITIDKSYVILRGDGGINGDTEFIIKDNLSSMTNSKDVQSIIDQYQQNGAPKNPDGSPYSPYSWTGGVIYSTSPADRKHKTKVADVTSGTRGEFQFIVPNADSIEVGSVYKLKWDNPGGSSGSFFKHVFGEQTFKIGSSTSSDSSIAVQPVTVITKTAQENGSVMIKIKEPLLHDIRVEWNPFLYKTIYLNNVGLEGFKMTFPNVPFNGHHKEDGYNAIYLTDLSHSWVKDISIHNSDNGLLIDFSRQLTLKNLVFTGKRNHYNIMVGRGFGILSKNFFSSTPSEHYISVNTDAVYNVYTSGYLTHGEFDQHNGNNHQNLFDNISVGQTRNIFAHGGSSTRLPASAQFNTFWNIRLIELPGSGSLGHLEDAPGARMIGIFSPGRQLETPLEISPTPYMEGINEINERSSIESLYDYQLNSRNATP